MRNIKFPLLLAVLLLVLITLLFNTRNESVTRVSLAKAIPSASHKDVWWGEAPSLPSELMYEALFEEIAALKQKDEELQKLQTAFKTSFYEDRLELKDSQFAVLDSALVEYVTRIRSIDDQARQIIIQFRAQYPNGELEKPKTSLPEELQLSRHSRRFFEPMMPPPVELERLQSQKNQIVINLKDKIRQSLGAAEFSKFDTAVQRHATKIISPSISHTQKDLQFVSGN